MDEVVMSVEFSLLELASVRINETPCDSFTHALTYAQAADNLGFKRFWLAEHHNMAHVASTATVVLIGYVASQTKNIRVGSGGIMLPNHSDLFVTCPLYIKSVEPGTVTRTDPIITSARAGKPSPLKKYSTVHRRAFARMPYSFFW